MTEKRNQPDHIWDDSWIVAEPEIAASDFVPGEPQAKELGRPIRQGTWPEKLAISLGLLPEDSANHAPAEGE